MQKSGTKREEGQNKCDGKDHKKLSLSLSVRRESESSLGRGELPAQWVRDIAQERAGLGIAYFTSFKLWIQLTSVGDFWGRGQFYVHWLRDNTKRRAV